MFHWCKLLTTAGAVALLPACGGGDDHPASSAIASTAASLTPSQLSTVLAYHVLGSQVLSTHIPFGSAVTTVSGQTRTINASPLSITDKTTTPAPITATDIRASNGVIHVISKVLIPTL